MNILADASLPQLQEIFKPPFRLTIYENEQEIPSLIACQDVLLCRSTLKVTAALLKNTSIRFVATASSGTDHIDESSLKAQDITLLDAKGSNVTSVADYVLSCVAYLQQHHALQGLRAGVIGVGAVGQQVSLQLEKAGFHIFPYDPPRAVRENDFHSSGLEELMQCDLICIHANLHDTHPFPSKNLLNKQVLQQLKKNAVIINASRGKIVNEADLLDMDSNLIYCTDVYANEPNVDPCVITYATLCTPHIAGHSIEAKHQAVIQVAQALYAAAQVPFPAHIRSFAPITQLNLAENWQETVLSFYNPWLETLALKHATDKKTTFLQLRKAHQFRHNFNACS